MPVLPKFALTLGAKQNVIGLVNGLFTVSALFLRPIVGKELDRRGRKGIYLSGLIIFLLAVCGYLWVPSLFLLLLLRIIQGVGWAGASTASNTIVADILPSSRRGEGMGYFGLCSILAMAIAPASGLYLLTHYSFHVVFIFSLVLSGAALITGQVITLPAFNPPRIRVKSALFDIRAVRPSIVLFFTTLSYGGIVTFLPLYADERGIANIGPFFTVYAMSLMLSRPLAGKHYDKKGPNSIVSFSMVFLFLSNLLLWRAATLPSFLLSGFIYGLGFGGVLPTMLALAMHGIEPHRRGTVNGTVMSAFDLGMGLGAIILGLTAGYFGYSGMYLLSAFAPLCGLVFFFLWPRYEKTNKKTGAL